MAQTWAYADWNLETKGTTAYVTKLSNHIKEVSEACRSQFNTQNKSHNVSLERYLDRLMQFLQESQSVPVTDAPTKTTAPFVVLRPTRT